MRVNRGTPDEPEAVDPLPAGTEYCLLVVDDVTVASAQRFAEHLPDDVNFDALESTRNPSVLFEPGDLVPLPIAREGWKAFKDRVALLDEHGVRLDSASHLEALHEQAATAVREEFKNKL